MENVAQHFNLKNHAFIANEPISEAINPNFEVHYWQFHHDAQPYAVNQRPIAPPRPPSYRPSWRPMSHGSWANPTVLDGLTYIRRFNSYCVKASWICSRSWLACQGLVIKRKIAPSLMACRMDSTSA